MSQDFSSTGNSEASSEMLVTLSSKGHIALPEALRKALGLGSGSVLKIESRGRKIILEPVLSSMIDRLHGKFAGESFLADLEAEHRKELFHEDRS